MVSSELACNKSAGYSNYRYYFPLAPSATIYSWAFPKSFRVQQSVLECQGRNFWLELREQLGCDLAQYFGMQLRYLDKRLGCLTGFAATLLPLFQHAF
jgi:hypothetical protein